MNSLSVRSSIKTFVVSGTIRSFDVRSEVRPPGTLTLGSTAAHVVSALNLSTVTYDLLMQANCAVELAYAGHGRTWRPNAAAVDAHTTDPVEAFEGTLRIPPGLADGVLPCRSSVNMTFWRLARNPKGPREDLPSKTEQLRLVP